MSQYHVHALLAITKTYLGQISFVRHDDIVLESDDDILVCAKFEVVGDHAGVVLLVVSAPCCWMHCDRTLIW